MIVTEGMKYKVIRTDIAHGTQSEYKFYNDATVLEVTDTKFSRGIAKIVYADREITYKSTKRIQRITYVPLEHIVQAIPDTERIYVKIFDEDCTERIAVFDWLTQEEIDYTREAGLTVEVQ